MTKRSGDWNRSRGVLRWPRTGGTLCMPIEVTRNEFQQLEGRVIIVEREVEGEKMVTRHILEQTRRNSDDLAAIKTRLDRIERKVDGLEQKFDGLEGKVGGLDGKVDGMAKSLPTIIADVMREVLRERDGRP
ncbi:MAG: hypothetical protein ACJ8EN_20080 [Xanthobacteraceae bacterium]